MIEAPPPNPMSALQHAAGVLRDIANHVDISNVGRYKWLAIRAADQAEASLAAIEAAAAAPAKAKRWKSRSNAATDQTPAAAVAPARTGPNAPAAR